MRYLLLLCVLSACAASPVASLSDRKISFASKRATEATLTFSHEVEMESSGRLPSKADALEQIEEQVRHLFGPMERASTMAAPKEDHTISNVKITRKDDETALISYDYEGTIVVEKGPRSKYNVILPNNPDTIYQTAMVGSRNPCTDEHYQTEGDFWYFWSPAPTYRGCKLQEGEDYQIVEGTIDRIKPTKKTTYPEYDRLVHDGEIRIDVIFGLDETSSSHDPARSRDVNAEGYRDLKRRIEAMGFEFEKMSEADARRFTPRDATLQHIEVASKEVGDVTLRIRMFFGETGIDEDSKAFHYFFRDSLQNSSIMIYDGHSGLGGHLDLADIQSNEGFRINLPKNRYQIYFFNSCTSYTYYNALYFQKKHGRGRGVESKGTKNLDILANGLETAFDDMQKANFALIEAVHAWADKGKWKSYQKLAKELDDDNLFTVNGDEDNPTKAR